MAKDRSWSAETIFDDREKGHWLAAAELDGRNGTDEIIGSGYGARIVLLSRPPGYGLPHVAVEPQVQKGADSRPATRPADLRVAVAASPSAVKTLSSLAYGGGFETKTSIFETFDQARRRGTPRARPRVILEHEGRRRTWSFVLREDAVFHDGRRVDAEAVRLHFKRWLGLPQHAWLGTSRHARDVRVVSSSEVELELDRPYAVPEELTAINPTAVMAPASLAPDGSFVRPIGSGPFRSLDASINGSTMSLEATRTAAGGTPLRLDLVIFDGTSQDSPLKALLDERVDVVSSGWYEGVGPSDLERLKTDTRFEVSEAPGSSVWYLVPNVKAGPLATKATRRQVAQALDREALVRTVELQHARPCDKLFSAACWPRRSRECRRLAGSLDRRPPPRTRVGFRSA